MNSGPKDKEKQTDVPDSQNSLSRRQHIQQFAQFSLKILLDHLGTMSNHVRQTVRNHPHATIATTSVAVTLVDAGVNFYAGTPQNLLPTMVTPLVLGTMAEGMRAVVAPIQSLASDTVEAVEKLIGSKRKRQEKPQEAPTKAPKNKRARVDLAQQDDEENGEKEENLSQLASEQDTGSPATLISLLEGEEQTTADQLHADSVALSPILFNRDFTETDANSEPQLDLDPSETVLPTPMEGSEEDNSSSFKLD